MKDSLKDSTEEKIKMAARELFLEKGLKGTTIREVAEKAGANVALVNYYFRKKNNLFLAVFKEKFQAFSESGYHILYDNSMTFTDRLEKVIDHYIDLFLSEPNVPIFILSEAHYNQELLEALASIKAAAINIHQIEVQGLIDEEAAKGKMRPISLRELEMTMMSMIIFPFISRPIMTRAGDFRVQSFENFVLHWRKHVKSVILTYMVPE